MVKSVWTPRCVEDGTLCGPPPWTSSYLAFILEQHSTAKSAQSTFCFSAVGYLSARANLSLRAAEIAVILWFIEGHVMFQIRGAGQHKMNCRLQPPKRTCGHICEEVDGKYRQTGVRGIPCTGVSSVRGRGSMQGWAQPG